MTKHSKLPLILAWSLALTGSAVGAELPERVFLHPELGENLLKEKPENIRITESGERVISNVHAPAVFPYLPDPEKATGAAVIIAPGGGHQSLWSTHEGHTLAAWLQDRGVAAFVLHYRLAREAESPYSVDKEALADTQRAIQLVRSRAGQWHIEPDRVGVLGFSAGGELAELADMRPVSGDASSTDPVARMDSKPSFVGLIYPGSSQRFEIGEDAAPVFIVCGYTDRPDISRGMAELYLKYKAAAVPAELHIYATAGHGFGMRDTQTSAVAKWPERLHEWLADIKMLDAD